jgi:hypothetical protein
LYLRVRSGLLISATDRTFDIHDTQSTLLLSSLLAA